MDGSVHGLRILFSVPKSDHVVGKDTLMVGAIITRMRILAVGTAISP
jgi:hypothetical protein